MSFVHPAFDWYSVSVPVIIYVISYDIGPRYNGTRMYMSTDRIIIGSSNGIWRRTESLPKPEMASCHVKNKSDRNLKISLAIFPGSIELNLMNV